MSARDEREPIKVTDRRKLDADGEMKDVPEEPGATPGPAAPAEGPDGDVGPDVLPPMNFAAFLLSLSTMAMVYMGVVPDPASGKPEVNLALAQQHIDILGMLQDKTRGNLTHEEERLLSNLLYELRMQYVSMSKS